MPAEPTARPPALPTRGNDEWLRAIGGDGPASEAAQRELRAVLVTGLRRILTTRGVAEDLCEDLAQEALVRIRARLDSFRGESRFTTWALAIATRLAFDELRHKRWRDLSLDELTADAAAPAALEPRTDATQDRVLVRDRVLAELREVLDHKLTEKQRAVLIAELRGMPHTEIASALGMNRNAVYKLSFDARKRVRAHLEAAGISAADALWVFE